MPATAHTLTLTVNGEPRDVPAGTRLPDLLCAHGIDPDGARGVAVAVNDAVVRRRAWGEVALRAGDTVEIVTAMQGG